MDVRGGVLIITYVRVVCHVHVYTCMRGRVEGNALTTPLVIMPYKTRSTSGLSITVNSITQLVKISFGVMLDFTPHVSSLLSLCLRLTVKSTKQCKKHSTNCDSLRRLLPFSRLSLPNPPTPATPGENSPRSWQS